MLDKTVQWFVEKVAKSMMKLKTARDAAIILQRAFGKVQKRLLELDSTGNISLGLLGGVVLELRNPHAHARWIFICLTVGHSKSFVVSSSWDVRTIVVVSA